MPGASTSGEADDKKKDAEIEVHLQEKKRRELQDANKAAEQTKKLLKSAFSDAHMLLTRFQTDDNYKWGDSDAVKGSLKKMTQKVEHKMTTFDHQYLLQEWPVTQKKNQDKDELKAKLCNFTKLGPAAKLLKAKISSFLKMHSEHKDEVVID